MIIFKEPKDIDSLFEFGGNTALKPKISELNEFELICFLVIK